MMRDRRVVQADPADKWQADSDAVQVKPEIEPQNVDFDTFLKTNTGPEQAEDGDPGDLYAAFPLGSENNPFVRCAR